ncbi:hypothetical protein LEP1GSC065_2231 [Leptospira kirschneri serovar Sokoine str. RM1]|nr:hypothetical protein LEP1GSC065_2231 [Leptospira kirschneri serovar Sokoine str. RM1]
MAFSYKLTFNHSLGLYLNLFLFLKSPKLNVLKSNKFFEILE